MRTAQQVVEKAKQCGWMVATAESCTGGLIAGALTDIAGSSAVVDRGFITYSNSAKVQMIGVAQATLDTHGAVSEQIAREMAMGALSRSDADVAVSVTGIAGPGGSDHKPEGMVCFGIATATTTHTETRYFGPRGRASVRDATVRHALMMILRTLDSSAVTS